MSKRLIVFVTLFGLIGFFLRTRVMQYRVVGHSATDEADTSRMYLPVISKPMPTPTPTPVPLNHLIENRSFEDGWTNMPPAPGYLINQQPAEWNLSWLEPGELLYDSGSDRAGGVPECVHKHTDQLPPDEQSGGVNALILDGDYVYKIFHFGAPFGAELKQSISGLQPGSNLRLLVPIQVHLHGETDPYAAESGVWVNEYGSWVNGFAIGDRTWYEHAVNFTVPANGNVTVTIRVKSKWPNSKDFFIDHIRLEQP